jgi:hypothetical protein
MKPEPKETIERLHWIGFALQLPDWHLIKLK